jgi:adenylate cyclase class IV
MFLLHMNHFRHIFATHVQVMLRDGETEEMGQEIAHSLMKQLDITEKDLISVAYMDLLQENATSDIPTTIW